LARRETIARLERAGLWAWPPAETASIAGWLARAGGAASRRLNSVATLTFEEDADPENAVRRAEQWYAARDLPACFHLTDVAMPEGLDALLAARGYRLLIPTEVRLRPLGEEIPPADGITLETRPRAGFMNAIAEPHWDARLRAERAATFARIRRPHVFAVDFRDGIAAAGGVCVVTEGIAVIHSMRTRPEYRRQGRARAVLARLLAWGAAMGAREAMLQVQEDNAAARALYEAFGFAPVYRYQYRQP